MAMTRPSSCSVLAAVAVVVLLGLLLQATPAAASARAAKTAAGCDLMQLRPCSSAFAGEGQGAPSSACCGKLKAQGSGCLCLYKDDPNVKRIVSSSRLKKVFTACKVPAPSC
uniref:Bifunctional inhibitor/plant lipid transfer protein/seed storage helical domain-containing protein n=1 Tax=Leersia perrieri TaxID=77586 RepID=A0A0D9V4D5_9ORYZ